MPNNVEKAQFALLAALNPEQFIEVAVSQGFQPQEMLKGLRGAVPKGQSELSQQLERLEKSLPQLGAPPVTPAPTISGGMPPTGTGMSEGQRAAGFDAALGRVTIPPMGAGPPPTQAPFQRNDIPAMGDAGAINPQIMDMIRGAQPRGTALTPPLPGGPASPTPIHPGVVSVGGPPNVYPPAPNQPGKLSDLIAPGGPPAVPLVDLSNVQMPNVAFPQTTPDIVDLAAGALGGLADQYLNPAVPPGPGGPAMGPQPAQAPVMGNPGEVSPEALAAVGAMPQPQTPGIVQNPNEAISGSALSHIIPPESELGKIIQNFPALSTLIPPTSAAGQMFGITSPTPGAGLSAAPPPMSPFGAPSQNIVDLTGTTGGALPPIVPQTPPPVPPEEQQAAPTLTPISSATTETAEPSKAIPSEGKPDRFLDALSKVQSPFGKGGGGRGGGAPGSAGIRGGAIQQGELLDMLMKSLRPAQYTPGFIPYGKF